MNTYVTSVKKKSFKVRTFYKFFNCNIFKYPLYRTPVYGRF